MPTAPQDVHLEAEPGLAYQFFADTETGQEPGEQPRGRIVADDPRVNADDPPYLDHEVSEADCRALGAALLRLADSLAARCRARQTRPEGDPMALLLATLRGGNPARAETALAAQETADGGPWTALVRADRLQALCDETAAVCESTVHWDGATFVGNDGDGTVEMGPDGKLVGTGCYEADWIAARC
jgi:hypothetical protein